MKIIRAKMLMTRRVQDSLSSSFIIFISCWTFNFSLKKLDKDRERKKSRKNFERLSIWVWSLNLLHQRNEACDPITTLIMTENLKLLVSPLVCNFTCRFNQRNYEEHLWDFHLLVSLKCCQLFTVDFVELSEFSPREWTGGRASEWMKWIKINTS